MAFSNTGQDTVWTLLERRALLDPHGILLNFHSADDRVGCLTGSELCESALHCVATLSSTGISPGDRVAILSRNSDLYISAMFALARMGVILVPLNWLLTAHELAYQLKDSGACGLICETSGIQRMDHAATLASWHGHRFSMGESAGNWVSLTSTAFSGKPPPAAAKPDDIFEILYTSGTTSLPKGVMLSHRSIVKSGLSLASEWSLRPDDVIFTVLPLFHVNAQLQSLIPALVAGSRLFLHHKFSASRWIDQIRSAHATMVSMVGTQIRTILTTPERSDDADNALRFIPYGANVPLDMWAAFEKRFGVPLINVWGLTESVGVATSSPLFGDRRIPANGRAIGGREIAVVNDAGEEIVNELGEIRVRGTPGETLMAGYFNRPEATAEALRDGWLYTGDLGTIDEDGYLKFVDRSKDVIKRSGENVSASEVEEVLLAHPAIAEAAIVGKPDAIRDEQIVAVVVLRPDSRFDPGAFDAHCREFLASYKAPSEYILVASLPRTSIGKIEKRSLRALLASVPATAFPKVDQ